MIPSGLLESLRTTVVIGIASPLLAAALGWPLGVLLRAPIRASRALQVALLAPLVLSPIVSAYGWFKGLQLFGISYGLTAVVVVCALGVAPWVVLQVATAAPFSEDCVDVARTLGARRFARWRFLLLPVSRSAMTTAVLQGALWCVCTFTIAAALGGGPGVETLEISIYQKLRSQWDPKGALVASALQLALGIFLIGAHRRISARALHAPASGSAPVRHWIGAVATSAFFLTPLLVSLPSWLHLKTDAFSEAAGPLGRSVFCAATASLITAVGAILLERARGLGDVWVLLTGVSPIAIGFVVWMTFGRFWDPFEGALVPIIAIHVLIFGGLAARAWRELRRSRPLDQFAVARTLGATRLQVFARVEWPRVRQPFFAALALVFAFSLTDVSVSRVMGSTESPLFGSYLMSIAGQYRIEEALALGTLGSLAGISALLFGARLR